MKKDFYFSSIVFILFVSIETCYSNDYYPGDTWRTSTPEAQGMDSGYLADMLNNIQSNKLEIHSVVIIRHGYLVLEAYKSGFGKEIIGEIHSVTKSFTSALIGIAIREGYIKNTDQKALDFLPEIKSKINDKAKEEISIKNLLTMTSGFDWPEFYAPYNMYMQFVSSQNWTEFIMTRPLKEKPGTVFNYNTGGTHLLSVILSKTTGMKTSDFADKFLLKPIGITNYTWQTDPQGINAGGHGISMTPMEMARFGYLYLKKGNWKGIQIIPADWVEASLSNRIDSTMCNFAISNNKGYGFLWWGLPFGGFSACGYGGQYIMVIPERDMVVVFMSDLSVVSMGQPLALTELFILKSIVSDKSIQENPRKQAALESAFRNFGKP